MPAVFSLIISGVLTTWTPPFIPEVNVPLPLPPACTYALTTRPPLLLKVYAILNASSGVLARAPF